MGDSSGFNWRAILWSLLKPALVAAIVALLVAMGVTGLRSGPDVQVGVLAGTHFSGPVQVTGGIETGNNLTMTVGGLINSRGAITVTDGLHVTGNATVAGGYLTVTNLVSSTASLALTTGNLSMADGYIINSKGAVTITDAVDLSGDLTMGSGALINSKGAVTVTDDLNVSGNVFDDLNSLRLNDAVLVSGTLGVSGATALAADLTVGTWAAFSAQTAVSVTTNGYITATGSYQPLTSFGNVFTAKVAAASAGRLLRLSNQSATTITITDTATIMLSADWAGGQYDTLTLMSDGTNWLEIARSNN